MKSLVLRALASGLQPVEGAGELVGWLFGAAGVGELGQGYTPSPAASEPSV